MQPSRQKRHTCINCSCRITKETDLIKAVIVVIASYVEDAIEALKVLEISFCLILQEGKIPIPMCSVALFFLSCIWHIKSGGYSLLQATGNWERCLLEKVFETLQICL